MVNLSETCHHSCSFCSRYFYLSRYREKVARNLDLARVGTLPNKHKKGKGVLEEVIIAINNGIKEGREDMRISKKLAQLMDFNSERGLKQLSEQ